MPIFLEKSSGHIHMEPRNYEPEEGPRMAYMCLELLKGWYPQASSDSVLYKQCSQIILRIVWKTLYNSYKCTTSSPSPNTLPLNCKSSEMLKNPMPKKKKSYARQTKADL